MKNLYAALGLDEIVDDRDEIQIALAEENLPRMLQAQVRFVLLQPTRKARYDWVLRCSLQLAEARLRLGLPKDPRLLASEIKPTPTRNAQHRELWDPRPASFAWPGAMGLAALCLLAWWGFIHLQQPDTLIEKRPNPVLAAGDAALSTKEPSLSKDPPSSGPAEDLNPLPPPDHGWIQRDPQFAPRVPWWIDTDPGRDYLLTLLDAHSQAVVLTIYLHGGMPYQGQAPEGEFELIYSSGTRWFGLKHGFGPGLRLVRSERIHQIRLGPDEPWVWKLQLHSTSGEGTLINPVGPPNDPLK